MKNKRNKRVIILIAILAFLAAVLILREILFPPGEKLTLVKTQPVIYQTDVDPELEAIVFQFNQTIADYNFTVNVFPDFSYQIKVTNDQLIVTPEENLIGQTKYLVEIRENSSSFYFPLEFSTLSSTKEEAKDQTGLGDPQAEEEVAKTILENYPLFYQTPKKTALWQADYSQKQELTVTYQASESLEAIQKEVFAWMESEGVDPQTHNFKWQPVNNLPN